MNRNVSKLYYVVLWYIYKGFNKISLKMLDAMERHKEQNRGYRYSRICTQPRMKIDRTHSQNRKQLKVKESQTVDLDREKISRG